MERVDIEGRLLAGGGLVECDEVVDLGSVVIFR